MVAKDLREGPRSEELGRGGRGGGSDFVCKSGETDEKMINR